MKLDKETLIGWVRQPDNWFKLINIVVAVVLAYWLARVFWLWVEVLWPVNVRMPPLTENKTSQINPAKGFDVSRLLQKHLFGEPPRQVASEPVVTENVPETRLNLKLRGIYAAADKTRANAIIEDERGRQSVYFIGDKLKVSGQVFLRAVESNRVVLETNGRREVLTLKEETAKGVVTQADTIKASGQLHVSGGGDENRKVLDRRRDKRLSNELNRYRQQLRDNPMSFSQLVTGRPALENGQMIGIRISPGKNRRLFSQLGLRRNDVITAVNGIQLNNMQEAMSLYAGLDSLDTVEVAIKRGKEELSLLLDLNPETDDAGIKQ